MWNCVSDLELRGAGRNWPGYDLEQRETRQNWPGSLTWNCVEQAGTGLELHGTGLDLTWNCVELVGTGLDLIWNCVELAGTGLDLMWNCVSDLELRGAGRNWLGSDVEQRI